MALPSAGWTSSLNCAGPPVPMPELTFGDYQTTSMGSPRDLGYTYNWALAGANTATLLSQGQHTGVAIQVREGLVQYVAVFIGTNDFQPASAYGMYEAIYSDVTPFNRLRWEKLCQCARLCRFGCSALHCRIGYRA